MNCEHESFLKSSVGEEASSVETEDKAVGAAPAVRCDICIKWHAPFTASSGIAFFLKMELQE